METKFFTIWVDGKPSLTKKYASKEEAEEGAHRLAYKEGLEVCVMESIVMVEPANFSEDYYEDACKHLGIKYTPLLCSDLDNIGISNKHVKAISAIYKLIILAEAWNKTDNFIPDYNDIEQEKWYPWFSSARGALCGLVCTASDNVFSYAGASLGARLCFKTKSSAIEFGKRYLELWSDLLLIKQ